jgi:hypothetical protein
MQGDKTEESRHVGCLDLPELDHTHHCSPGKRSPPSAMKKLTHAGGLNRRSWSTLPCPTSTTSSVLFRMKPRDSFNRNERR